MDSWTGSTGITREPAKHAGSQALPGPTESKGEPSRGSACRLNCEIRVL